MSDWITLRWKIRAYWYGFTHPFNTEEGRRRIAIEMVKKMNQERLEHRDKSDKEPK